MLRKPKLELGVLQRKISYIDGFPRWGCFVACILTLIQRSLKRKLTDYEVQQWFWQCVTDKAIKHNNLPIRKGIAWDRCYVLDRFAAFNIGMLMFNGKRKAIEPESVNAANVRIYRWKTLYGYHFTYGNLSKNLHDPDPRLRLLRRAGSRDLHVMETTT